MQGGAHSRPRRHVGIGAALFIESELTRLCTHRVASAVGRHTDPGTRSYQEDAAWSVLLGDRGERVLMVVADGAGGESDAVMPGTVVQLPQGGSVTLRAGETSGHLAAWIAAESIRSYLQGVDLNQVKVAKALRMAFAIANRNVVEQACGGVTTLTVGILEPADPGKPRTVILGHVGDSPAYRVTHEEVALLQTKLHHDPYFGNIITRAIGHQDPRRTRPDIVERTINAGEKLVIGSDGIVPAQRLLALLLRRKQRPQQVAEAIVDKAVELGGYDADNATVLVWHNTVAPPAEAESADVAADQPVLRAAEA